MATRDELVAAVIERYSKGRRAEKGRILDEFVAITGSHTDSGRWTRVEDSCVVGARIGWCAVSRGGEAWRGLLLI